MSGAKGLPQTSSNVARVIFPVTVELADLMGHPVRARGHPSDRDVGAPRLRAGGAGGRARRAPSPLTRNERGEPYFLDQLDRRPVDRWERSRRNGLLSRYGNYLGLVVLLGSSILLEPMAGLFERADDW